MPLSRLAAIKKLSWMVQANQFPELDSNALGELIDEHKRFSTWTAGETYAVGDQIVPTVPTVPIVSGPMSFKLKLFSNRS